MPVPDESGDSSADAVLYLDAPDAPPLQPAMPADGPAVRQPPTTEQLLARLERDRSEIECVVAAHDPPVQDGLAVLSSVRTVHPTVPFVLCTTVADPEVGSAAVAKDADRYVPAPAHDSAADALADAVEATVSGVETPALDPWSVFDDVGDGILIHDTDTEAVLDCNERFCEMLGYDYGELLEMEVSEFSATDHPVVDNPESRIEAAATEGPQVFEWVNLTKAGEELPVEVCLALTGVGDTRYVVASVRDVSDRKATERRLERKNERLERFASVVSHELSNTLYAAMARRELASMDCCDGACEHLDEQAALLARMDDILEDVLSLARERPSTVDTDHVGLKALAIEVWELVEHEGATIEFDSLGRLEADRDRLGRLLENLVQNAIDHADDPPTIEVGMVEDGFYVADDGPGIPPGEREAVLEYGYTTDPEGSGLGLNIGRRIAEMHGWTLEVTESDAGGTRIEVSDVTVQRD